MRILYWTARYWPDIGGTQTLAKISLRALAERGHEILVLTTRTSQKMPEAARHEGIAIRRMPFWSAFNGRDMQPVLRLQEQVAALKLALQPDLIHSNFSGSAAFFIKPRRIRGMGEDGGQIAGPKQGKGCRR